MKQTDPLTHRARIVAADKRHVWHPYTAMDAYIESVDPIVVARAQGSTLVDLDGRTYLDGNSSWWTAALGHGHPRVLEALLAQASALSHCALAGIAHEPAALLAEELVARAGGGLNHVFYTDNGSGALEVALRIALQAAQQRGEPARRRFLAIEGAFHGDTLGPTSLGDIELFRRPFAGLTLECLHVPFPDPDRARDGFLAAKKLLAEEGETIAAVVVEPMVQGAAGMRMYAPEFLRELRAACTEAGALLVVDEVFAGYGRTGRFFASEHAGVSGDLVCLGKALAYPIPLGAVLATDRVFDAFRGGKDRALYYGHTFCGNPLATAIAREVLRIYDDEALVERSRRIEAKLLAAFESLGQEEGVRRTRVLGAIAAADLEPDGARGAGEDPTGYLGARGWRVYDEARKRGAYLRPLGDTVYVTPPLVITDVELDRLVTILHESVVASRR